MSPEQYRWYAQKIIEFNGLVEDTATLNFVIRKLEQANYQLGMKVKDHQMLEANQDKKIQAFTLSNLSLNMQLTRSESKGKRWRQAALFFIGTTALTTGLLLVR